MTEETETAYVEFRGHGFWAKERCLGTWLHLLAKEIHKSKSLPLQLAEAAKYWELRSRLRPKWSSTPAGIPQSEFDAAMIGLDRRLHSEDDVQLVLTASKAALASVASVEALCLRQQDPDGARHWHDTAELGEMFVHLIMRSLTERSGG